MKEIEKIKGEGIRSLVLDYFGITIEQLRSKAKTRDNDLVPTRQFISYFCRKYTKLPLSSIAILSGVKNHATAIHSCRVIDNELEYDKSRRLQYSELDSVIKDFSENIETRIASINKRIINEALQKLKNIDAEATSKPELIDIATTIFIVASKL